MADSITFNGKDEPLRNGKTSLANLDALFQATACHEYKKGIGHVIKCIDQESLTNLENIAYNTDLWINASIKVVGMLMANADHSALDDFDLKQVGWLLTGLSELKNALDDANTVIENTKTFSNNRQ